MKSTMTLTPDQQAVLDGSRGETVAKVMRTLVMYGETFGATKMVDITSDYGHLVTSFGMTMMKPIYDLMDTLIDGNALSNQKFTVDPHPVDPNVPVTEMQASVFAQMYGVQENYEKQLEKLGLKDKNSFTCTCYMDEVGNKPKKGEVLSWAESSAVVYSNSVLGARCNRNSGILELFGSIAGCVPYFGLLTDEGRKATWVIEIKTKELPEAQILGSAIGMKVMEDVPYIKDLSNYIGTELDQKTCSYLKDMGAATASNGAVGLYHVDGLTPEAVELGEKLIDENAKVYVIDDAELERVKNSYPCIWEDKNAAPALAFIGCPHLSLHQLIDWTKRLSDALLKENQKTVTIPTVFTAAPDVLEKFNELPEATRMKEMGAVVSYICPLMYMNNPISSKMPVVTNSNKLRTYSTARYYTEAELLSLISKGAK